MLKSQPMPREETAERSDSCNSLPLGSVLNALPQAALVVDADQRICLVNPEAESLLGRPLASLRERRCRDVLGCSSPQSGCPLFADDAAAVRESIEVVGDDGSVTRLLKRAAPVRDGAGQVTAVVVLLEEMDGAKSTAAADRSPFADLVGRSAALREIVDLVRRLGPSDVPVLITGETGTGKELIARSIHSTSRRRDHPFVAVNSGAIPPDLAESELFGHVKGSFTGAVRDRKGAVEAAEGGTFFLDEVGDLPLSSQAKLLRLLQDRTYQRVGDPRERRANIRVVAATHVDLERAVADGRFRQDLYYRLRVVPIRLPALRDRPEDIAPLASILLARRSAAAGRHSMKLTPSAIQRLERHSWPGNVRELVNLIDYLVALCPSQHVGLEDLPSDAFQATNVSRRGRARYVGQPAQEEAGRILEELRKHAWHRQQTADALGMDRVTLYRKMKELGIQDASDDKE